MNISINNIALAVTTGVLTTEFAKILHEPPFPSSPLLNFEIRILNEDSHHNRKRGILTLPTESTGKTLLRACGDAGIAVGGRQIFLSKSTQAINMDQIKRLNNVPWKDPIQLRKEKERLLRQNRPLDLLRYSFGRFLRDGTFSSQVSLPGSASIFCDLQRQQVRFTFRPEGPVDGVSPGGLEDRDGFMGYSIVTASYVPLHIAKLVGNQDEDTTILFIRADAPPVFALETSCVNGKPRRLEGLGLSSGCTMPQGCHSLMLAFSSQSDADTFTYACCSRLHLRCTEERHVRIHDHSSDSKYTEKLHEFLSQIPYELAFEVNKAFSNSIFRSKELRSLKVAILSLQTEHGNDAPEIFRAFAVLRGEHGASHPTRRRRQRIQLSTEETLNSVLAKVIQDFLRARQKPRPLLTPTPQSGVYLCYHLVITPTRLILEGPFPDRSNSVLRRYGHQECFLRVSFQDEKGTKLRRDNDYSVTELLLTRYRPFLLEGCTVAGRRFQFLGYSMSGLKEHSVWFMTPFRDENGELVDANKIRNQIVSRHHNLSWLILSFNRNF
jgi:RNA-dependent RNA polymerase